MAENEAAEAEAHHRAEEQPDLVVSLNALGKEIKHAVTPLAAD
jgi:hypothetical protein